MSASEIIKELPKLSDAERQAVLDKLRELAQVNDDRWDRIFEEKFKDPEYYADEPGCSMRSPLADL